MLTMKNKQPPQFNDDDEEEHQIRIRGNEIWFWGPVTDDSMLELTVDLRDLETSLLQDHAKNPSSPEPGITLFIKTAGGDMFAGLSTMDFIWNMRVHVTTVADGCCASAGTFLLLGGHTRLIKEYSFVLIHQLSCEFWGKFSDAKDDLKSSAKFMKIVKAMYRDNTKLPEKKLKTLMKRDVYLSSAECVKYNVVHNIY